MSVVAFQGLRPTDLLITDELFSRRSKLHDLQAEVSAFHELASLMISDPGSAIQRFLDLALRLCDAGSAGVSLLDGGKAVFRWTALAGEFAPYVGGTTPRNFSPCGLCLDAGSPILISRPARLFDYFDRAHVPIIEGLIVPLYDTGRVPLGTLWVVSHDERRFEANDARVMEQLAAQLVLALKVKTERASHQEAVRTLQTRVADKDAAIQEVHHRVKNTIQATSSLLRLQARGVRSDEARAVLDEAQARLGVFATVHELLYRTADSVQQVGMADLLSALTDGLRQSFSDQSNWINLRLNVENITLNPDQAIPIALAVNEAVTNAYKHAFPGLQSGEVLVEFGPDAGGALRLSVRDNGAGMPSGLREGSLGLRLIRSFAKQLNAELVLDGAAGTTVQLSFVPLP